MKNYIQRCNKELYLKTKQKILKLQKNRNEGLFFLFSNDNKLLFCNDINIFNYYQNKNQAILCYDLFHVFSSTLYSNNIRTYRYNNAVSFHMHFYLYIYDRIVNNFLYNKEYKDLLQNDMYHIDYEDKKEKCNRLVKALENNFN